MSKNIDSLQAMRAVAACSVVFTHTFGAKFPILGSSGIFGVDLFFALSGFLMTITYREDRSGFAFLKNRILRIYPSYLVLSLPLILWCANKDTHDALFNIFHNITLFPTIGGNYERANYVCWTLTFEMYFYLIMAASMYVTRGVRNVIFTTSFIIAVIFLLSGGIHNGVSGWADNSLKNLTGNYIILDFIMGSLIGLVHRTTVQEERPGYLLSCAAIFLFVSFILTKYQPSPEGYCYQIFTILMSGIPAAITLALISRVNIKKYPLSKFFVYVGSASYSIYLVHLYIRMAIDKLNLPGIIAKPLIFSLAIAAGCLCYEIIEKRLNHKSKPKGMAAA